jgi:hypothetical protein
MGKGFLIQGFGRRAILFAAGTMFIAGCLEQIPEGQTRFVKSSDGETITYNVYRSGDITLVFVHGWSWRQANMMHLSSRDELKTYAAKLQSMQFQVQKPKENGFGYWPLRGITYIGALWGDTEGVTNI